MVRAALHDDRPCDTSTVSSVTWALDDDCGAPPAPWLPDPEQPTHPSETHREVTVVKRTKSGYDDDGNPTYAWSTLFTGPAIFHEERTEVDSVSGITVVEARATVAYAGQASVFETAEVREGDRQWRVVKVSQPYGRVEFVLRLIEQERFDFTDTEDV